MVLHTFRDTMREISPRWLRKGLAEKILYAIAIHADLLGDAIVEAVKRKFPGYDGSEDALPLIGRDRKIHRGPDEDALIYASRLTRWLTDHATRGGPYALLEQVGAYYAAAPFVIDLVYATGTIYRRATDGTISRVGISWNVGGLPANWARWWLFYTWPTTIADDGRWGDYASTWGDSDYVWGVNITVQESADLLVVPTDWKAAHVDGRLVVLSGGGQIWGYPSGIWGAEGDLWGDGTAVILQVP